MVHIAPEASQGAAQPCQQRFDLITVAAMMRGLSLPYELGRKTHVEPELVGGDVRRSSPILLLGWVRGAMV